MFSAERWEPDARSAHAAQSRPLATFLTAAHELRSPLASLLGELQLLRDPSTGPLNPTQDQAARQIAETCSRMQRILEDCFAFGRLESGEVPFQAQVVDVEALLLELAGAWLPAYEKKGVALHTRAKGSLPPVPCDPHKLLRVLSNLLENALKFTPAGGEVELLWQPCIWDRGEGSESPPERRPANAVYIAVRDTGPGVAPENRQEIFEPFVRINPGSQTAPAPAGEPAGDSVSWPGPGPYRRRRSDNAPGLGLGLGLAVAQRLVQWHGGKIWVESAPGGGSVFALMLPLYTSS